MMTPEKLFWKFYWGMRTLSLAYKERINSVPEEVFDEIINQIKLFVCEIFTECLSPAILSMLRPSLNMNMLWVHPIKDLLEESRSMVNSQIPKLEVQMAH